MGRVFVTLLMCITSLPLLPQTSRPMVSTVTAVSQHPNGNGTLQYDVSLKVGETIYVVLYTPPNESRGAEYTVGQNVLVMIKNDTITFTKVGNTFEVPILRREQADHQSGPDWSRLPGDYFTEKLRHLSQRLDLTEDQQRSIKPILEQEAGEAGLVTANSVLSTNDKFKKLETIVLSSDQKMKALLSIAQWNTLQTLRKQQTRELKERLEAKAQAQ